MKKKYKLGICTSFEPRYKNYIAACEELGVEYEIIDILSHDWLDIVRNSSCDGFLLRPPSDLQERKTVYDERMYYISHHLKRPVYPGFDELYIYENKRNMAAWLDINGFSHAKTRVFLRKDDALEYLSNCEYPVVFKSNIGYGAHGVKIIKSRVAAKCIAHRIFGIFHPKLTIGYFQFPFFGKSQKHYLIVQDFKKIKWEWRIIKIGNSYFGHQKLLKGQFASGSKLVGWVKPPVELLDLVKNVSEKGGFRSLALDVFETVDDKYVINEIQSIFGSYNPSQMYINDIPGRFVFKDGEFVFEEGYFNKHGSYMLRVQHFLEILDSEVKERS